MLGLEFEMSRSDFPGSLLSVLAEQEVLTPLISSYLLNAESLRVAPTLNGNKVIRLEPPLTVTRDECQSALKSLKHVLEVLDQGNTLEVLRPVLDLDENMTSFVPKAEKYNWDMYEPSRENKEGRFAFLCHPLDLDNYYEFDESLASLTTDKLQQLAELGSDILDPFVIGRTKVESPAGYTAYGEFIALPHTTKEILEFTPEEALKELDKALEIAQQRGARLVGLGAYTSVVSRGGTLLQGHFLPLTTGNSYTVVSGAEAIKLAAQRFSLDLAQCTAAIIGATGSIGRLMAILLAEEVKRIVLIGNPRHPQASLRRLRRVAEDICLHLSDQVRAGWIPPVGSLGADLLKMKLSDINSPREEWAEIVDELIRSDKFILTSNPNQGISMAQVVVTATSSVEELVKPEWVTPGAIICDISKPSNVNPELQKVRPDVLVIDGGVVALPGRPSLGWNFGFEPGLAYACMAETMLLALEHHYTDMSLGSDLRLDNMIYLRQLAKKHGFELARLRSFDRPLSEEDWEKVLEERTKACLNLCATASS